MLALPPSLKGELEARKKEDATPNILPHYFSSEVYNKHDIHFK